GLRQHLVMQPHAVPIQGAGVVLFLAYVQADEHRVIAGDHLPVLLCEPSASWPQSGAGSRHPRYEETYPQPRMAGGGPVPISGHPTPPAPATTPPGSCERQGQTVIPGLATSTPNHRSYEEGNGACHRVGRCCSQPQSRWEASRAPSARVSSLAQAICGWIRPPSPQSVEAMTRSFPTAFANRSMRSATSSGCSTTLVAWETTPGRMSLPSGSSTSCHTFHSCSWRTLPASKE